MRGEGNVDDLLALHELVQCELDEYACLADAFAACDDANIACFQTAFDGLLQKAHRTDPVEEAEIPSGHGHGEKGADGEGYKGENEGDEADRSNATIL